MSDTSLNSVLMIRIVDRVKELIKYKGYQVPPAELEAVLLSHPLVIDAGVIGIYSPSEETEHPRAYIVPRGGLSAVKSSDRNTFASNVEEWVAKKVANHKQLRGGVVLVDNVPRSPAGKILRKLLQARAAKDIVFQPKRLDAKL